MPRRRSAPAETEAAADTGEIRTDDSTDISPSSPRPNTAPTDSPVGDAETPAPRRRRSPRRKTTASAEETTEAASPAEVPQEAPSAEPDAVITEEAPRPKRPRRRTPRKTTTENTEDTEVVAGEAPAEAPPAEAAPAEPVAEPAPAKPRRTRGTRKAKTEAAATEAVETSAPPAPDVITPEPATVDLIAPAGEAPAPARPRRTRGVRKPRTPGTAAETGAPAVPTLPALPAPPAYQALPAGTLARLPETRISVRKNVADLLINGEPRLPLMFFVNTEEDPDAGEIADRQIRAAYGAGIRLFTVLAHLPWKTRSGERRTGLLDAAIERIARHAPDAFVLPRLIFSPPASWERAHPDEMVQYGNGEGGDVSLGSRAFWEEEAEPALRAAVEHIAQGPHASRVFGVYLEHGEWFHDATRGPDGSPANTQAFRAWLRARYKHNQVALRAAWHEGDLTFETAEVPSRDDKKDSSEADAPLLFRDRERRWADFYEFSSDIVAQVITQLGRAAKEASGNRLAVAVSYGYTLELPRAGSGHLSLAAVLASPAVDILTGPVSYASRAPGEAAPLPAPVDSIALAGKMWISEDDTKTFLARGETPDAYNARVATAEATRAVHTRNWAAAHAHGAGVSWMDLWGQGWLDDPAVWEHLGRLRDLSDKLAMRRRNPRTRAFPDPDVAVIVDERSFFGVRADEQLLGTLIAGQRDALLRSGARVGFYLLSDLARRNFPEAPRLLLFLNAFRFTPEVRMAIRERFQRDGRTLAWVYGPGCLESADTDAAGEMADVIGMHLRLQAWGSKTGTILLNVRSPLTNGQNDPSGLHAGQRLGAEERVTPSFTVIDARAQILGEYAVSGNPSLAVRRHDRFQSVFIGETVLTPALLRGLYRLSGVPTYTTEDDVAWIGDSLICLHSAPGGPTTVVLPEEACLYDLLSGETLASGGRGARVSLLPNQTRVLFFGTPAEVARLGGDPQAGPPGLTAAELPPPPTPFSPAPSSRDTDISPEDEALLAAALTDVIPLHDKDDADDAADDDEDTEGNVTAVAVASNAPAETADTPGKKRRRRRRGRRGRATDEETAPTDADANRLPPPVDDPQTSPENDVADGDAGTGGRTLPPLSELLPDSEFPDDAALPPIPPEFLPLGDRNEDADISTSTTGADAAEASPEPTRRRGRPRQRRGRNLRAEDAGETAANPTPSEDNPRDE